MPEVGVAGDLPSTLTGSGDQGMLLNTRNGRAVGNGLRNTVLTYQPLCRGRIDQHHVDLVAVLLAEFLKRLCR